LAEAEKIVQRRWQQYKQLAAAEYSAVV